MSVSESPPETVQVAGVILYRDGKVLMQHRDDKPEILYPGAWAFFGGHVEPGEEPEAAAIRELQEELELELSGPLELVNVDVTPSRTRFIYAAPLTVPIEQLVQHEGQGMALFSRAQLAEYPLVPSHRRILEEHFKHWPDA